MNQSIDKAIILFVKYPEKGRVKSRLSKDIGARTAIELYKIFVLDLLAGLEDFSMPLIICFYPNDAKEKFIHWLGTMYNFVPQKGKDLGERMKNAFVQAFEKDFKKVILIGSDIPDLPMNFIEEAFLSLSSFDAVIGPSPDGGYYLIGFRDEAFIPEIFEGITWSSNTVLEDTLNIFQCRGVQIHSLPTWRDIDTILDLKDLMMRHQQTRFSQSKTISYLLKHNHIILDKI